MRFDHIGIFVSDLQYGLEHLSSLIGVKNHSKVFSDSNHHVKVQFLYDSNNVCYEIVAPHGLKNPVDGLLKSRKNLLNHIAYKVTNIEETIANFKRNNCLQISTLMPSVAFNGAPVTFFLSPLGFVIELISEN